MSAAALAGRYRLIRKRHSCALELCNLIHDFSVYFAELVELTFVDVSHVFIFAEE